MSTKHENEVPLCQEDNKDEVVLHEKKECSSHSEKVISVEQQARLSLENEAISLMTKIFSRQKTRGYTSDPLTIEENIQISNIQGYLMAAAVLPKSDHEMINLTYKRLDHTIKEAYKKLNLTPDEKQNPTSFQCDVETANQSDEGKEAHKKQDSASKQCGVESSDQSNEVSVNEGKEVHKSETSDSSQTQFAFSDMEKSFTLMQKLSLLEEILDASNKDRVLSRPTFQADTSDEVKRSDVTLCQSTQQADTLDEVKQCDSGISSQSTQQVNTSGEVKRSDNGNSEVTCTHEEKKQCLVVDRPANYWQHLYRRYRNYGLGEIITGILNYDVETYGEILTQIEFQSEDVLNVDPSELIESHFILRHYEDDDTLTVVYQEDANTILQDWFAFDSLPRTLPNGESKSSVNSFEELLKLMAQFNPYWLLEVAAYTLGAGDSARCHPNETYNYGATPEQILDIRRNLRDLLSQLNTEAEARAKGK